MLSNRADLISGGDALIGIDVPEKSLTKRARVAVEGRDVTLAFASPSPGKLVGRVKGLKLGRNQVRVETPDGRGARIVITNHPTGGPVFSGPQIQPWTCQAAAVNRQCDQKPEFTYLYQSIVNKELQPYDPASPPSDVATTTTDVGKTVPFIVRQELGYQDRSQYKILMLWDPSKAAAEQHVWNRKVFIPHGGGCGGTYGVDEAPLTASFGDTGNEAKEYSYVLALRRGFGVLSTALENAGANCNIAVQAESLMMAKEHINETYGLIRYTIGSGCSGGSLVPQQVANAYPGIYQGLTVTCSFPDFWSSLAWFTDLHLVAMYFNGVDCDPAPVGLGGPGQQGYRCEQNSAGATSGATVAWTPPAIEAVLGRPIKDHLGDDVLLNYVQGGGVNPYMSACAGIPPERIYNPSNNPGGIRCSTADWGVSVLGHRTPSVWTAAEKKIKRGFGGRPYGNVGVMYGLKALRAGQITVDQFVNVNSNIGAVDIDLNPQPARVQADQPALRNAYRSGSINDASQLNQTAIINGLGPNDGVYAHPPSGALEIRARLDRQFGRHDSQVLWEGPTSIFSDSEFYRSSLLAMDRWLAAVERDKTGRPLSEKIIKNRPRDVRDSCFDGTGRQTGVYGDTGCPFVPVYKQPRQVAGAPATNDVNACQLKPLRKTDFTVPFTDVQWTLLRRAFPQGVCDYSKPGISQHQRTVPWQTYQDAAGRLIPGGRAMPPAPVSIPFLGKGTSAWTGSLGGAPDLGAVASDVNAPVGDLPAHIAQDGLQARPSRAANERPFGLTAVYVLLALLAGIPVIGAVLPLAQPHVRRTPKSRR